MPARPGPILAISGSLRRNSINSAVLRAAADAAARDGVSVVVSDAVRTLPHFDPDLEPAPSASVVEFRDACDRAAALLLAVPEYAFGIPGAFKNALDWTVGSGSLYGKRVAVLDVAPAGRGAHVREALDHVLRASGAHVTRHTIAVAADGRDEHREVSDLAVTGRLRAIVAELVAAVPLDCHAATVLVAQRALRRRSSSLRHPHRITPIKEQSRWQD
jgi:NAD(P)H-dependent FMN reductase